ncbi:phosphatidylcholine and lysophosphatidylcholine phospholipase [Chytridiales sp. JEL 0842]|nr:phosphatidylcholine and lysophosphatidylcholine phospholipase [Chytridiales sp. JEL 0842]
MFTLAAGLYELYYRKEEYYVLILGLDNAGKTTLLERIKGTYTSAIPLPPEKINPTVGLNIGRVDLGKTRINFWDLGGQRDLQRLWNKYYNDAHAVVFVIDATDMERIEEVKRILNEVIEEDALEGLPLLLLANKSDQPGALSEAEIKESFNQVAMRLGARDSKVMSISALVGQTHTTLPIIGTSFYLGIPASYSTSTMLISPLAIFKSSGAGPGPHGCPHLAALKTPPPSSKSIAFPQAAKEFMESYRAAIQGSLRNASKIHLVGSAGGKGKSAGHLKKDEETGSTVTSPLMASAGVGSSTLAAAAAGGKKRKRPTFLDNEIAALEKVPTRQCNTCQTVFSRLHVCLHCPFVGCWKDKHIEAHAKEKGHNFAMDAAHCQIYCFKCKDYVYDYDLERILHSEKLRMDSILSRIKDPTIKKPKSIEWNPSLEEAMKIKIASRPLPKCTGLRGLRNMGSTCFMNVVLQTFAHNPLLRAHFLSDKHNQHLCPLRSSSQVCIACEMDNMYTQFYNGEQTPYGPSSFLFSMWKCNAHLATYSQHDAHEFFMAVLNEVHNHVTRSFGAQGGAPHTASQPCKCVVHQVFSGVLQSDVTCQKCFNVTTTYDPILDFSLTIRHSTRHKAGAVKVSKKKKGAVVPGVGLKAPVTSFVPEIPVNDGTTGGESAGSGDMKNVKGGNDVSTLVECLERNFAAEKLTHYQCGNPECSKADHAAVPGQSAVSSTESIKHVTIKSLPPVLAFQLKRFEHSGTGAKIETYVRIPLELDMTPYTTRSVKSRTRKMKAHAAPATGGNTGAKRPAGRQVVGAFEPTQYMAFYVRENLLITSLDPQQSHTTAGSTETTPVNLVPPMSFGSGEFVEEEVVGGEVNKQITQNTIFRQSRRMEVDVSVTAASTACDAMAEGASCLMASADALLQAATSTVAALTTTILEQSHPVTTKATATAIAAATVSAADAARTMIDDEHINAATVYTLLESLLITRSINTLLYYVFLWIPYHLYEILRYTTATLTVTFDLWTLLVVAIVSALSTFFYIRYIILTKYSRLPPVVHPPQTNVKPNFASFDLHPDAALDDDNDNDRRGGYADEFMGAFLSSIKVFGYLDRPVFHELARHLQTRKLKAGEVLYRSESEERDFYVVVEGTVNLFVKGPGASTPNTGYSDSNPFGDDSMDDSDPETDGSQWPGYHLLNEVKAGGTLSSMFAILSVFTDDAAEPKVRDAQKSSPRPDDADEVADGPKDDISLATTIDDVTSSVPEDGVQPTQQGLPPVPDSEDVPLVPASDIDSAATSMISPETSTVGTNQIDNKPPPVVTVKSHLGHQHHQHSKAKLRHVFPSISPTNSESFAHHSKNIPKDSKYPNPHPSINAHIIARAATDATLAVIPAEAFRKLTAKFPKAAAHMVQVVLTRFQRVTFLTLHRYLGLSKELLRVERGVGELGGPEGFLGAQGLEELRVHLSNWRKAEGGESESEGGSFGDVHEPSGGSMRKASAPVTSSSLKKRAVGKKPAKLESSYEADLDESERESVGKGSTPSVSSSSSYRFPATSGRPPLGPSSTTSSRFSSSPSNFKTLTGSPAAPSRLRQSVVNNSSDSESEEDRQLKDSIFECISTLIGMIPTTSQQLHHPSPPVSRKGSMVSSTTGNRGTSLKGPLSDILFTPTPLKRATFMAGSEEYIQYGRGADGDDWETMSVSSAGSGSWSAYSASASEIERPSSSLLQHVGSTNDDIQIVRVLKGDTIVREGERVGGLWFCAEGVLEASIDERSGAVDFGIVNGSSSGEKSKTRSMKKSLFLIKPGGLAGYLAAITSHPSFVTIRAKTDAVLGFLPKSALDRYIERYPNVLLSLAKRLIHQLSPLVLHIDVALDWGQVNAGQVLCRQNDPSEAIYIVLNGRLRAIAEKPVVSFDDDPILTSYPTASGSSAKAPGTYTPETSVPPIGTGETGETTHEIMGEFGKGDSVGELEVLTDTPRPATVHAIRDTEVAIMPKTLFNALAIRHPEITIQISRIIASRARGGVSHSQGTSSKSAYSTPAGSPFASNPFGSFNLPYLTSSSEPLTPHSNVNLKTVALLPVNSAVPITEFAEKLRAALELVGAPVRLLNTAAVMGKLGKHAFTRLGRLKLVNWLAEQEDMYRLVVYVADGGVGSPWTLRCVRQADCILLVGLGDEDPSIGEYERLLIGMKTTARKELVLLHNERYCLPGTTARWLKNRLWIHAHHHVQMPLGYSSTSHRGMTSGEKSLSRKNTLTNLKNHFQRIYTRASKLGLKGLGGDPFWGDVIAPNVHTGIRSDFARLARRLLSRSIGLVLGGGGARGIAHVGILRAFEEAGIPIDMVGGTSIGSFVGGVYARENDAVSLLGRMKVLAGKMSSKWRQIVDLTYPVVSLFTGHEFNRAIWKTFYETQIEDCWLPYFAVTTNITDSRMEVHRSGYIWRYIRASMTLTGYFPPLCDDGKMLVDGGYLNNLPADVMQSLGAEVVIAVDIGRPDHTMPVSYGDSLSGWWMFFSKWNPWGAIYGPIPQLPEIQSRLAYVGSVKQLEEARAMLGGLYLQPPVRGFGTVQFECYKELLEIGYKYGKDVVRKWEKDGTMERLFGVKRQRVEDRRTSRRVSI